MHLSENVVTFLVAFLPIFLPNSVARFFFVTIFAKFPVTLDAGCNRTVILLVLLTFVELYRNEIVKGVNETIELARIKSLRWQLIRGP